LHPAHVKSTKGQAATLDQRWAQHTPQARELMSLRLGITCDGFAAHQLRVCEALAACTRLTELKVLRPQHCREHGNKTEMSIVTVSACRVVVLSCLATASPAANECPSGVVECHANVTMLCCSCGRRQDTRSLTGAGLRRCQHRCRSWRFGTLTCSSRSMSTVSSYCAAPESLQLPLCRWAVLAHSTRCCC
jgi:hypothetical protein